MKLKKNIKHIVILRAFATILVVLGHATRSIYSPNHHMYSPAITPSWEIAIKEYIYSFHMPLFFFISGYVFHYSNFENKKNVTTINLITNKIKRLLIPMYSTSFLILLPTIMLFGHLNGSILYQIKLFIFGINNDHLWFLTTLFIIFLIMIPSYNFFNPNNISFFIVLLVCWLILYIYQPSFMSLLKSPIKYFPYFVMGCLCKKFEYLSEKLNLFFISIIFFFLHFFAIYSKTAIIIYINKNFIWYVNAFMGIYFTYCFSIVAANYLKSENIWLLIKKVDIKSYSIYLFHVSFLYLVLFFDSYLNINIPGLRITVSFIGGLFFSMILHSIFSKNTIISQAFSIPNKKHT